MRKFWSRVRVPEVTLCPQMASFTFTKITIYYRDLIWELMSTLFCEIFSLLASLDQKLKISKLDGAKSIELKNRLHHWEQ